MLCFMFYPRLQYIIRNKSGGRTIEMRVKSSSSAVYRVRWVDGAIQDDEVEKM